MPARKPILIACCLAAVLAWPPLAASETPTLERVESPPVSVDGATTADLSSRARACMAQSLTYGSVTATGAHQSAAIAGIPLEGAQTTSIAGGDVFQVVDLENGLIVARSRITIGTWMPESIESTVTFEAKPGKFRLTHTNVRRMMTDTGISTNDGYRPVLIQPMSGHAKVAKALEALSTKLSSCIAAAPASW